MVMVAADDMKRQSTSKADADDKFAMDTGRHDLDLTPRDYFQKVANEDLKQNKRLSLSYSNGRSYKLGQAVLKPTRLRFVICVLGLLALAMSQMSRMILNLTITQMVEQEKNRLSEVASKTTEIAADGSCPWPEDVEEEAVEKNEVCPAETTAISSGESVDLLNDAQTTITAESFTDLLNEEADSTTTLAMEVSPITTSTIVTISTNATETEELQLDEQVPKYPQFKWSIKQQNVLLGGFFYSYFVFMVAGGRLAEVYGAKYILMSAVAGSGLINLATPWMAVTSFELLVGSRILMGALQAGVVPGLYALIAKWLTMTEASIFAPLIKLNLRLGMLLGSSIPGLITGWPNVFYLTGLLGAAWSVVWMFLATSDPADNTWVSPAELQRIERKKQLKSGTANGTKSIELKERDDGKTANGRVECETVEKSKSGTPWVKILTAPSVVALIAIKLTFNFALDFITIELPSYLNYVHHATKEQVSSITSAMYFTQVLLIVFVGWLAKVAVQRRPFGLNKTGVRKLFQGIASFGLSLAYLLLTFNNCSLLYVAILFNAGSFLSMFASGGETVLPYDLSEKYPATIVAIANSIANISAVATTTTVALVLGDQKGNFARWNVLLYLVAAVNFIGGLVFTLLVKAEPIDFERRGTKEKKSDLEAASTRATVRRNEKAPDSDEK